MSNGTKLAPGAWPVDATCGDRLAPTTFAVSWNGSAATITTATATVRRSRARDAELVVALDCAISGNQVTVTEAVLPNTPGTWWWDLEVDGTSGATDIGPLTIVAGPFRLHADVSVTP